jgi:cell division protein FtsQ
MNHAAATAIALDIRIMNWVASVLGWMLAVMVLSACGIWVVRHPAWMVRTVEMRGQLQHQTEVNFRSYLAARLNSHFLTLKLSDVQQQLESVPWVRKATVQRAFPNKLIATIEEHQPMAWWGNVGSGQWVNTHGELFETSSEDDAVADTLPELAGPPDRALAVKDMFEQLSPLCRPLGMGIKRLELTTQGSWRMRLDNGARIELGRGEPLDVYARFQQFVATLPQALGSPKRLLSADLRYASAYAIALQGASPSSFNP